MIDPTLCERLNRMTLPTLVLWGDSDQIVDPDYGRTYARLIPTATFQVLTATGHLPQIETPAHLLPVIWAFADNNANSPPHRVNSAIGTAASAARQAHPTHDEESR
jgi:pimeloyl-ACP methyl ester carboxylesterase